MSLVVEDGTGKANADAYCSVAFVDSYLAGLGVTSWGDLDDVDDKEPAIRRATGYIGQYYRMLWQGSRATYVQSLDWPRNGVVFKDSPGTYGTSGPPYYPPNVVPIEVQQACALLAYKAIGVDLSPDLAPPVIQETVGPITVKYAEGARQTTQYQQIDNLLAPFLTSNGNMFSITRG